MTDRLPFARSASEPPESSSGASSSPSRRTVVGAALWSVPAITLVASTPALALSGTYAVDIAAPTGVLPASGSTPLTVTIASGGAPAAGVPVSLTGPSGAQFGGAAGVTDANGVYATTIDLATPWTTPGSSAMVTALVGGESTTRVFTVYGANLLVGGNNSGGQLGLGSASGPIGAMRQTSLVFPSPVVDARGSGYPGGNGMFTLALLADGSVWATGQNQNGTLGDGTTTSRATWAKVPGLPSIVSIAAMGTSSYAIDTVGDVWAWGGTDGYQLGESASGSRATPARIPSFGGASRVYGAMFTARLSRKNDGTWWGWGGNGNGELADGTFTSRSSPVRVTALDGFTDVADGFGAGFVGLRSDGSVWAWGRNNYGQLCDGTTTSSAVPKQIPGLTDVTAIAGTTGLYWDGFGATGYALKTDGTLWAWGRNDDLQIDSTRADVLSPVQIASDVVTMTASQGGVFALKSNGSVWNRGAQLAWNIGRTNGTSFTLPRAASILRGATSGQGGAQAVYMVTAP